MKRDELIDTVTCRVDLLTVKGFCFDIDTFDIDMDLMRASHPEYRYDSAAMRKIIEILTVQNLNKSVHLTESIILEIYALADYLGLEVFVSYCRSMIKEGKFIKNPRIFELLLRYPYPVYNYSEAELNFILKTYNCFSGTLALPPYLIRQLHDHARLLATRSSRLNDIILRYENVRLTNDVQKNMLTDILKVVIGMDGVDIDWTYIRMRLQGCPRPLGITSNIF